MDGKLLLGDYNEPEKLENENKAFHLSYYSLSGIDEDQIFDLVTTGKWIPEFSEIVENNLLEFIYNIIPKYAACFTNANINGILKIGIDDSCEITGIPILGNIPKTKIKSTIIKTLSENIVSSYGNNCDNLFKNIKIEYIPLITDPSILTDDAANFFNKLSKELVTYNDKMDKYLNEHALFLVKHRQYTQKLELMLNKTKYRKELIEFIELKSKKYKHLINLLESDDLIKLKKDDIYNDRENKNKIFYWIAKFRDLKTTSICKNKPVKPAHPSIYHFRQIVSNLPAMRYKFIKNNPQIKYYIIKLTFNVSNINDSLEFKDKYNTKWQYRRRIEHEQNYGPGCI